MPTLSGVKSTARKALRYTQRTWWLDKKKKLSKWYKSWDLDNSPHIRLHELDLPRATLARLLSIPSMHGDSAGTTESSVTTTQHSPAHAGATRRQSTLRYAARP
jgi:hypothetical protein